MDDTTTTNSDPTIAQHPICTQCIADGQASGYEAGKAAGVEEGRQEGYKEGRAVGITVGRNEANAEHEQWKERITDLAHQHADEHNLCGEFDRFMTSIGLRPRSRDFNVRVNVNFDVTVTVTATSDDEAEGLVDSEQVLEEIKSDLRYGNLSPDWDVRDVESA